MADHVPGTIAYTVAGVLFFVLSLSVFLEGRHRLKRNSLVVATLMSAAWAFSMAYGDFVAPMPTSWLFVAEMAFDGAWLFYLGALFDGATGDNRVKWFRLGGLALVVTVIATGFTIEGIAAGPDPAYRIGTVLVFGSILTSLLALSAVEQLWRNARPNQLRALKFSCLATGCIFGYDLLMYTNAVLAGQLSALLWETRGAIVAATVPLFFVAVRRSRDSSTGLFVSRKIVFYTATILGTGIYLTIVGLLGYFLKRVGGDWGEAAQLTLFSAGAIALAVLLISERLRRHLLVFINKNFFKDRYDYRAEWLQLIRSLSAPDDPLPVNKRAVMALAGIVDSHSGRLWLRSESEGDFACDAGWNMAASSHRFAATDPLIVFLADAGWIIDLTELDAEPKNYVGLSSDDVTALGDAAYVVPLLHVGSLIGFVTLSALANRRPLNYEDRDILKTAGMQIAGFLAQDMASKLLYEHKQFETFNRLTAFLMHDLKNLIAQQSLVVENAEKHKSNPEFVDDAIETVKNSVARMRRVVEQLRNRNVEDHQQNVDLSKLLLQVVSQCGDRNPVPRLDSGDEVVWVRANRDQLFMALVHAVRNAQDAVSDEQGTVELTLRARDGHCEVQIEDSGCGMDETFIRERLFTPFDSTKGTHGMGIGAYQLRETVLRLGGKVNVISQRGEGTRVVLSLPCKSDNRL